MQRPSKKELFHKLRDAKIAVQEQAVFLINLDVIAEDAIELGYDIGSEFFDVLMELIEEAELSHYAGSRPPQRSYEDDIEGLELFAFAIESCRFGCRLYFKFALKESSLWLVSLHKDRLPKEE